MVADPFKVDSKHYTSDTENEQVRVVRIHCGPREKSPMHDHPNSAVTVVSPSDAHFRFKFPDGNTQELRLRPGESLIVPGRPREPENLSAKPFDAVLVELKRQDLDTARTYPFRADLSRSDFRRRPR
jgi:uncharacterized RmlC-like cupin family protein